MTHTQSRNQTIVSMQNICKHYRKKQLETHALQDVSLEIKQGEYIAITGPSGCGKSSLLSIIGLMDTASSGSYKITDIDTSSLSTDQRTHIRNQHIGFVFQSFNLIDRLNVFENVALPLAYRGSIETDINQRVSNILTTVGMLERKDYKPNQLSGGQQQRVAIARALVGSPDLILVDEPTGNLDSANGDQVMALLQQLNQQGTTIVMVTHDTRYAQCATRQIQLLDGKIIAEHLSHCHQGAA